MGKFSEKKSQRGIANHLLAAYWVCRSIEMKVERSTRYNLRETTGSMIVHDLVPALRRATGGINKVIIAYDFISIGVLSECLKIEFSRLKVAKVSTAEQRSFSLLMLN